MSKERLEDIKTSTWNICECETCYCENFKPQMIAVDPKHFEWLIEQAERVEELEEFKRNAERMYKYYHISAKKSVEEKERYKQALDFYADEGNHHRETDYGTDAGVADSRVMVDGGKTARKALEGEE